MHSMGFRKIRNRVIHRSVCTRKQSQILDILGNIEILARTRPGKMARMVTLGNMHLHDVIIFTNSHVCSLHGDGNDIN